MKNWGLVVTLLYAVIVIGILSPALLVLATSSTPQISQYKELFQSWQCWVIAGFFVLCQAVLLSLSVSMRERRFRSRTPVAVTAAITGLLLMIVTAVVVVSSIVAVTGENRFPSLGSREAIFGMIAAIWLVWGILFYFLYRDSTDPVTRALAWLFRGSVLELLIAVPAHVIVRRRHECCAPAVTGFGITSGIALMLISFGPSVLLLFKKRMERYPTEQR